MEFLSNTWAIVQLLLGFTFIITVHELGHFLVAKQVGIRCTQFAVGFGQALLCYRKGIGVRVGTTEPELRRRVIERATVEGLDLPKEVSESRIHQLSEQYGFGETEYRLNWMPLGGYVKMVGQDDMDAAATSVDPRSFTQKSIGARMAVISAGVIMNAIFAVIFFILAFSSGVEFPPAVVGYVPPETPAATTPSVEDPSVIGLMTGDRVVSVDGEPTSDFTSVLIAAPLGSPDVPIKFVVDRPQLDGSEPKRYTFMIKPSAADKYNALPYVGIGMPGTLTINDRAALTDAGVERLTRQQLRPGMRMNAVNDVAVSEYWQFDRVLQKSGGAPLNAVFIDEQGSKLITLTPSTDLDATTRKTAGTDDEELVLHLLGLVPAVKITGVVERGAADGLLKAGDVVQRIGSTDWPTPGQVIAEVLNTGSNPLKLTVLRDDVPTEVEVTPRRQKLGLGKPLLGIMPGFDADSTRISGVLPDSPLAKLDVMEGTVIRSINGQAVADFTDIRAALQKAGQGPIVFEMIRPVSGGVAQTQTVELSAAAAGHLHSLRWNADLPPLEPLLVMQKADHIGHAVVIGFEKTHLFMVQTYITLARLIQGWLHVDNLRGPVGIVAEGRRVTQKGWAYLMFFLGLISINLAVINFLPMPIVDGGLAVLLILEKLRGKPLPASVAGTINLVGLILIGTLFITLTVYDVARLLP